MVLFLVLIFTVPKNDDEDHHHKQHADFDDDDGADDDGGEMARETSSIAPWAKRNLSCPRGTRPYDRLDAQSEGLAECVIRAPWPKAVDHTIIDTKADPCHSFEAFACGRWAEGSEREVSDRAFTEAWTWNLRLLDHVEKQEASRTLFPWDDVSQDEELRFRQMVKSCVLSLGERDGASTKDSVESLIRLLDTIDNSGHTGLQGLGWTTAALAMHGVPNLMRVEAHRNPLNRREPLLYLERWGFLGGAPEAYHKRTDQEKHRRLVEHACGILVRLGRLQGHVDVDVCALTVISIEKRLMKTYTEDDETTQANIVDYLRRELVDDMVTHGDLPHVMGFDFARGFYQGLLYHMDSELADQVSGARVWLHRRSYFEELGRVVERHPEGTAIFLRVAVVLDAMNYCSSMGGDIPEALVRVASRRELHRLLHTRPGSFGGIPRMPWSPEARLTHLWGHVFDHTVAPSPSPRAAPAAGGEIDPDPRPYLPGVAQACIKAAALYLPEIVDDTYAAAADTLAEKRHLVENVTRHVLDALVHQIEVSAFLDDETRAEALRKARAILIRVAVPWTDRPPLHEGLDLDSPSFYTNAVEGRSWHTAQIFASTFDSGRGEAFQDPVNARGRKSRFDMPNFAVNAYYDPSENTISILAGILRAPFFDQRYSNISLYATIGAVVGHELSHAFDSHGIWWDAEGDARLWLSQKQAAQYRTRTQCYVREYGSMRTRLGNLVNGSSTLGENIADGMGLRAAYAAVVPSSKAEIREFLEAYAQLWCSKLSAEEERKRIATDVHSVPEVRINGAIRNLRDPHDGQSPLIKAYGCKMGDPMVKKNPCAIW